MGAVGKIVSVVAAPFTGGFSLSGLFISVAAQFALSAITRALAPKPKAPSFAASDIARQSLTQNVRQAITSMKRIYGEIRVGGPFLFWGSTEDNLYVHFIVGLCGHEVEAINEVWFNDTCIPNDFLDAGGNVISGRYNGVARIKKYLGTNTQTADSDILAEFPELDSNFRLRGIAYIYVRLKYDQDTYPSGIPNVSAVVKGAKVFDPRTSQTRFTTNSVLYVRDYLTNELDGFGASASEIDDTTCIASANASDEFVPVTPKDYSVTAVNTTLNVLTLNGDRLDLVIGDRVTVSSTGTLPAGLTAATNYFVVPYQYKETPRIGLATSLANSMAGTLIDLTSAGSGTITVTKNAEPRYHGAGSIDTGSELAENIQDMLSSSGAKAIYAGGLWQIRSAIYETPLISLNESNIISPISVQTRLPRRERLNSIKGVYTSPINDFQPSDYPTLVDNAGITADGEQIWIDYDLPFTNRPYTAQRLAKIELKKARQELLVKATFTLHAMQIQAGSTVLLSVARMGWVNKVFDVIEFKFIPIGGSDNPSLAVELTLRETAAEVYDWAASEESNIDPAPNTNLPNPWVVVAPTGLSFDTTQVITVQNDQFFNIIIGWDFHPDAFVVNAGQFEIQFKLSSDIDWSPSYFVAGNITRTTVTQGSLGAEYDLRIRAVNNLGVRSAWNSLLGVIIGSAGGVTGTEDWGFFIDDPQVSSENWGAFVSDPVTETDDWGDF